MSSITSMNFPTIPKDLMDEILACEAPFETDEERKACERMLDEYSEEDQEILALSSYTYWVATLDAEKPSKEIQRRMALKEVRRNYVGEDCDYKKGRKSLQGCLEHRKGDWNIHILRACFFTDFPYENDEERKLAEQYRGLIESDLEKQVMVVRGLCKEDRPILSIVGRTVPATDTDAYVLARLYILERAIAIVEVNSRGKIEKLTSILDFSGNGYSPKLAAAKKIALIAQHNYPERLRRLVILNPPLWARSAYNIVYPFLREETRKKFIIASGDKQKRLYLAGVVAPEQATTNIFPEGKLTSPTKVSKFLREVPFHLLYDDV